MIFDTRTLILCDISVSFVFFLTFAVYTLQQNTHPGFRSWTIAILVQTLAFLPLALTPRFPYGIAIVFTHGLLVLSVILKLNGLRQFFGNSALSPACLLLPAATALLAGFHYYLVPSIAMRNLVTSLCLATLMLVMAWELLRNRYPGSGMFHTFGATVLLANALSLLLRAYEWHMHPVPTFFDAGNHDALHLLIGILTMIGMNTLYLLMHSQRTSQLLHRMNTALIDSENRFRNLAKATFEGILFTHAGKIILANDNACALLGVSQEQLKDRSPVEFVIPEDRQTVQDRNLQEKEQCFEVTLLRGDGSTFPAEIHSRQVNRQEEASRIMAIRDLTARKHAEDLRHERDKLYATLFAMNRSVMLLIDPESGQIIDANKAACTFYGYSREELTARRITDINMLSEEEVHQEMQLAAEQKRLYFNFRHRLAGGEIHEVEVFTGPVLYHKRPLLCSIVHDITERRHKEKEREELITSLQNAAKEIKTLRGILPICSHCRKIRDDAGSWSKIEHYVRAHSEATFSHGICPDCVQKMYPELADEILNHQDK